MILKKPRPVFVPPEHPGNSPHRWVRRARRRSQPGGSMAELVIRVSRDGGHQDIPPSVFPVVSVRHGDTLAVLPEDEAAKLTKSWSHPCVEIAPGHSFRVPP